MSTLPRISGRECVAALEKAGFVFKRQQGSHMVLRRDDPFAQVVVPDHKDLDRGTLRAIIRQVGLGVEGQRPARHVEPNRCRAAGGVGDVDAEAKPQLILREVEGPLLSAALAATRGNQIRAADLLGVNRNTLRKKIRDLDLQIYRTGNG